MEQREAVTTALEHLKKGDVILSPTDTIYGLSCDATNESAVEKIKQMKGREEHQGFIVLLSNDRMLNQCYKEIPGVVWDLVDLADSPLTVVLDEGRFVASNVLNLDGSLGFRMLKKGPAYELVQKFGKPIVSTSPNLSGQPTPMEFNLIDEEIRNKADFVFPYSDKMEMSGKPSKIIRMSPNGEVKILRK
ncbi:MAG: L-threonylcarbamoyladenylate synthase [Vicingaceae bacterium]